MRARSDDPARPPAGRPGGGRGDASFFPAAEAHWPEWRDATWRDRSDLGLDVALTLIGRHPAGFLGLWARDWAALALYPNYWPAAWSAAGPPDRHAFLACRLQGNCWALTRYDVAPHWIAAMLLVSLTGAAGGLAVALAAAPRVLRRRAAPATALFWAIAVVLQASLLASSAAEAGFARYTAALHVLGTALLLWLAVALVRARQWRGAEPAAEASPLAAAAAPPSP